MAVLSSLWLSIASRGSANCLQLLELVRSIDWPNTAHYEWVKQLSTGRLAGFGLVFALLVD